MKFPIRAALVAVALASPLSVVDAQTAQDQDHSAHHPTDKAATPGPRGSMRGAGQPTMGPVDSGNNVGRFCRHGCR